MAKQNGALIKEARTAAGMTQAKLAEAVDGVSAKAINKAERGEKELTPEQLKAVAEALGVTPESLMDPDVPVILTDEEKELLSLFKSADADTQKATVSVLKGEKPQAANPMAMFAAMMGGGGEGGENPMAAMMGGGEGGANPMAAMMSMFGGGGEGGEGGANPMAAMMGMMGGGNQKKEEKKEE